MNVRKVLLVTGVTLLLGACGGGGGGGVSSTPVPPPTPTAPPAPPPPTPAPSTPPPPLTTSTSLVDLVASQIFPNDAVTSAASIDTATLTTVSTYQSASTLSVSYDAAARSYTVATAGRSESFGQADRAATAIAGQTDYEKSQGSVRQFFTLTNPASPINGGIQYVGGGYWQRNEDLGGVLDISFDAFTYGFETASSAMPRTGSAGYAVNMFGFFAPLNRTPKAVAGSGTFAADFRNGLFSTEGTAHEIDLTDPYFTGEHSWRGAGTIGSGNGFSGVFAYDGRDRFAVSGEINGRFYGPAAQELGAAFHAQDANGTLLAGTLLGRQSPSVTVPALSVLDANFARSYFTSQTSVLYIRNNGASSVDGAATVFPDMHGRLDVAADDSVKLVAKLSSSALPSPTFTLADRVAAESNPRYSAYRTVQNGDNYRLLLYNPGSGNDELALTYASFGRWDRVATSATRQETANVWFTYGVPTATNTLARTGSASYAMTLHGSGITFADAAEYALSGTASMNVDFNTMRYGGSLDALATRTTGSGTIDFVPLTFGGEMYNTYGFQSFLSSRPGFADGEIFGRLYGPRGEEVAANFDIISRDAAGFATGLFAGVAVGKKN